MRGFFASLRMTSKNKSKSKDNDEAKYRDSSPSLTGFFSFGYAQVRMTAVCFLGFIQRGG
jgi:hypothetical protein